MQWRAVQREAQLAAAQIAQGVTVLGRANHAQAGLYAQAFFGLSIGFERTGKLIFLADHAIKHNGAFPNDADLRKIGHDLKPLLNMCEDVSADLDQGKRYMTRPNDVIHKGIEEVISQFASKLRYYNLNHLANAAQGQQDPIALWWEMVATPICERHYSLKQRRRDMAEAALVDGILKGHTTVIHTSETGGAIDNPFMLFARGMASRVVQKYGRLYTLQIARWMAAIILQLATYGAYERRIEALLGLDEPYAVFRNDDDLLRDRRTWSIYP